MAIEIINSKADFDEKIKEGKNLVQFHATWCGPCKMLSPVIDQIAPELEENGITVLKIDVDQAPDIAQMYQVMSIPTMVLLNDGEEVGKEQGFKPANQLLEWTKALQ